ncbi:predicted protein [Naegleria gruberi]|uniref:Predicted protein n=1 Tax=Naegleria gruberi TaxID=5762 RepID=D2W4G6_NAEGR|nr:uncharacterized protein NAEGRDRAFT_76298 [Naegleria gruberi]EFC36033.1 predicted protein [Naegleria gruberi]|eukprot:XP_002668777.1 predicted protein [Naegleria gruberi strain NEG-M]
METNVKINFDVTSQEYRDVFVYDNSTITGQQVGIESYWRELDQGFYSLEIFFSTNTVTILLIAMCFIGNIFLKTVIHAKGQHQSKGSKVLLYIFNGLSCFFGISFFVMVVVLSVISPLFWLKILERDSGNVVFIVMAAIFISQICIQSIFSIVNTVKVIKVIREMGKTDTSRRALVKVTILQLILLMTAFIFLIAAICYSIYGNYLYLAYFILLNIGVIVFVSNEKGRGFASRGRSLKSILSGNISEKESQRLDNLFGVEYLEDIYDELRTGDVLLHSGKGTFSKAIQLGFSSTWSHLSIIIRNPPKELLELYKVQVDASSRFSTVFVAESETDTVDNKEGGGIQLVELRRWFMDYLERDPTDLCCLRRLNIPSMDNRPKDENIVDQFPTLVDYLKISIDKKYETSKSELLKCVIKRNTQSNDANVFCSEFVAECYLRMGLLPQNTITCNYGPRDFSQESNLVNTVLLKGANLTKEKRIRVREWDEKNDWNVQP